MVEHGYCWCGCGEKTVIPSYTNRRDNRIKGCPLKFIRGHNSKVEGGHPHWKGGKTKTSMGYVLVFRPDHPASSTTGYIFEHRLVMESMVGRYLIADEVVHHINHIRDDNRPENLHLFSSREEHSGYHIMEKALFECGDGNKRWCPYCKTYDDTKNMTHRKSGRGYYHQSCRRREKN